MISKAVSFRLAQEYKNSLGRHQHLEQSQQKIFEQLQSTLNDTRLAKDSGLASYRTYQEFIKSKPLGSYSEYEEAIHRSLKGRCSDLFSDPLEFVGLSSGTTGGNSKRIPYNRALVQAYENFQLAFASIIEKNFAYQFGGLPRFTWGSSSQVSQTQTGIPEGYVSGYLAQKSSWVIRKQSFPKQDLGALPTQTQRVYEAAKTLEKVDLRLISGVPAYLISLFEDLKALWGVESISEKLPNLNTLIYSATNIDAYKEKLDRLMGHSMNYLGCYASTEAPLGYELSPTQNGRYIFHLDRILFSFRRLGLGETEILSLDELQPGDEVELFISSPNGLLNYPIGDCLRICEVSPFVSFEIMGRKDHGLNVATEKVSMTELHRVVHRLAQEKNLDLRHFFIHPGSRENGKPCYEWTFVSRDSENVQVEEIEKIVDKALQELNYDYWENRVELKFLDRPLVHMMPEEALAGYFKRNSSRGQLKIQSTFETRESFESFVREKLEYERRVA